MVPFSVTSSDSWPRRQGHDIIQRQITGKWYKIELYLQWQTIVVYDVPNSAIFNDLERSISRFQGHAII